jgi:hypothetical protein
MSALNFHTKLSIRDSGVDLSNDAFIWASRNVGGRDAMEVFVSCNVWPLPTSVSFEHVKVDSTPISKLKIPLPRFPLCHEDEEDDAHFLVRGKQEARNIMGSYTHTEHEACLACLPSSGRLNRVLEVAGVANAPRPVPIFAEVLKKRKGDATVKASAKRPKVLDKKGAEPASANGACASGGSKRPSGATIVPAKFLKLSKSIIPRIIALVAAACTMPELHCSGNLLGASGYRAGDVGLSCTTVPGMKKAATSAKKCIVLAIGALAAISSEGTQ